MPQTGTVNKPGRKTLYAVVYWVKEKTSSIIKLTAISNKQHRHVGAVVSLVWEHGNGSKEKCEAKVLRIGDNEAELEKLVVSRNGEILDGVKALHEEDLAEKKGHAARRRQETGNVKKAKDNLQEALKGATPMFDADDYKATVSQVFGPDHSDSDSESDSQADLEDKDSVQSRDKLIPIVKSFLPKVSHENVVFLGRLFEAVKTVYEEENKQSFAPHVQPVNTDAFTSPGEGKVPLFDNARTYLQSHLKEKMEQDSILSDIDSGTQIKQWRPLVRQVLVEIYGQELQNYRAGGRQSTDSGRPAIDRTIYADLLTYAMKFTGDAISHKEFKKFINTLAANKRGAVKKRKPTDSMKRDCDGAEKEERTAKKTKMNIQPTDKPGPSTKHESQAAVDVEAEQEKIGPNEEAKNSMDPAKGSMADQSAETSSKKGMITGSSAVQYPDYPYSLQAYAGPGYPRQGYSGQAYAEPPAYSNLYSDHYAHNAHQYSGYGGDNGSYWAANAWRPPVN